MTFLENGAKPYGKHAVWVGNISEALTTEELEKLFGDFEFVSAFVVPAHKCAFVNFDDWEECQRAIDTMNDSEYAGKRLAVRLRNEKKTRSAPSTPPKPSSQQQQQQQPRRGGAAESEFSSKSSPDRRVQPKVLFPHPVEKVKSRYFIMKSHSQHDLDVSVERGVWATQLYNEAVLNKAFETCENVYLVFSINKSGEFFGLARMASPSGNSESHDWSRDSTASTASTAATSSSSSSSAASKEASPPTETLSATELSVPDKVALSSTSSPSSSSSSVAALPSSEEKDSQVSNNPTSGNPRVIYSCPPTTQVVAVINKDSKPGNFGLTNQTLNGTKTADTWGKPFAVQWLSLKKIPFQFTSHIRNQWNEGNEIKVSRDGTEIEPYAASLLHGLFIDEGPGSPGDAATGSATSPISSPMLGRIPYPVAGGNGNAGGNRRFPQPQFTPQGAEYAAAAALNGGFPYYLVPYGNMPYQHNGHKHHHYSQYPQYPQQMVAHPAGGAGGAGGKYAQYGYYQNGLYVPQMFYPVPQGWQGGHVQMQAVAAQYPYLSPPWPVTSVPQAGGGENGSVEETMENLSL